MARVVNGNKWKIIVWVTSLLVIGAGIVGTFAVLGSDVAEMKPKVDAHEKYIDGDKVDTVYIKRDIAEIKIMQRQILDEVRK